MLRVLHLSRSYVAAAALALGGCAAGAIAPASYQAVPEAQPGSARPHDSALRDMGLPPLRTHAARGARRELRLVPSNGPGGIPRILARVVDRQGAASTVEWLAFWDADLWPGASAGRKRLFHDELRTKARCGPIVRRGGTEFCRLDRVTGIRAAELVAQLDSVGAWPLPDPRHAPSPSGTIYVQIDGQSLVAEGRSGQDFQARHFGMRDMRADSSAAFLYRFARGVGAPAASTEPRAAP